MKYYIPFIGIFYYVKTLKTYGEYYELRDALFVVFMAFYHGTLSGVPVGLILSKILN